MHVPGPLPLFCTESDRKLGGPGNKASGGYKYDICKTPQSIKLNERNLAHKQKPRITIGLASS